MKMYRQLSRLVRRLSAVSVLAAAASLHAQTPPPPQVADAGDQLQEVVVTGTLIARPNAETAEAVTVVTTDDLKNMGVTSTEQALQQVVANQSTLTLASSVTYWSGAASFASLRGLGASKTLVLLDGQRLADNVVFGNAVDVGGIPFAAIDHIEVLREGASSLYGTDAIAGVINFITKKDYDKGELNINWNEPQHDGGSSGSGDLTFGKGNLATDGYNFIVSANYSKQNELTAAQRSFAATGWDPSRGLANQNGDVGPWPGSFTDPNNVTWQVGYPTCPGNPHLNISTGYCTYLYSGAVDLIPWTEDWSGLASFTKALGANNQLNIQYFFSYLRSVTWGGPMEYAGETLLPSSPYYPTGAGVTCIAIAGPCTPQPALGGPLSVGWTDPTNNRYNGSRNTEQRILATFSGNNAGWDYGLALNYSQNHNIIDATGYPNVAVLFPNGIVPNVVNPFGPQSAAGQAFINSTYENGDIGLGTLKTGSFNGHASHQLGDAFGAGRPAALALGFDARVESIDYGTTALTAVLTPATGYPPTTISAGRNEQAIYAELNVPITKQFEFTFSDREDRYSDFGTTNNAKVSLRYQPASFLTFRGAASTGFRAPSLVDAHSPNIFGATGFMTGPACPAASPPFTAADCSLQGLSITGGNSNLQPETSQNFDLGVVVAPVPGLGITVDYYRILLKNEIQQIAPGAIYANPTTFASLYVLNSQGGLTPANFLTSLCNPHTLPTCGYIIDTTQNTGGITTGGFDFSFQYAMRSAIGKFHLGLEGTLVTQYQLQEYQGGPQLNLVGQWNQGAQPVARWQSLLTIDWENGNWGAGASNHLTSHYTDEFTDLVGAQWGVAGAPGQELIVGTYSIWNGYVSWKPVSPLTLLVGIQNIFDTDPPFSNQTHDWQAGYSPTLASPLGRQFYARVKYDF